MPKNGFTLMSPRLLSSKVNEALKNERRGFTLIELLVSISIIGVLFAIVISSIGGVQRSGRNTQRQADLRQLQSALQHYYTDQGFYPTSNSGVAGAINFNSSSTTLTSNVGNPGYTGNLRTYLNSLPKDPSTGVNYFYQALPATPCNNQTTNCHQYCLYTILEPPQTTSLPSQCTASGYNYAITQP